jgi:hypothetical protein
MDQHQLAIDVRRLQCRQVAHPEPRPVRQHEDRPVLEATSSPPAAGPPPSRSGPRATAAAPSLAAVPPKDRRAGWTAAHSGSPRGARCVSEDTADAGQRVQVVLDVPLA